MNNNSLIAIFSIFRKHGIKSIVFFALCFFSCENVLEEEIMVYSSDFSIADLGNYENDRLFEFDGNNVLGYYFNEEVKLNLSDLPDHNSIKVTVEILLHDSWDGNSGPVGGPDFWYFKMDGQTVLRTTFSNSPCETTFCYYQSYPDTYPRFNTPRTGALRTDLPGRCQFKGVQGKTTLYRITKFIRHKSDQLTVTLGDELKQENTPDPSCDESWSLSSIQVSTLTIN